jgi:hypothetical protein
MKPITGEMRSAAKAGITSPVAPSTSTMSLKAELSRLNAI